MRQVIFTALHRAAGATPGPITDEILDAAIAARAPESDELDWKSALPPSKGLSDTDFPKDVAAMANGGGGVIVYGVSESQKAPDKRVDVGDLSETHERSLRSAAITAISPPVFSLNVHRVGVEGQRAVVVEVPASVDAPHLIYKHEFFGAPLRNDADTVWMKERQIEAAYRARFDESRRASSALDALFSEMTTGRDTETRAWLISVAQPRTPRYRDRLTREDARKVFGSAQSHALVYAGSGGLHPIANVDRFNPRPGLRRWIAANTATGETSLWKEAWMSLHHDGAVSLAAAVGGHRLRSGNGHLGGHEVESSGIECSIADFMGLLRATALATHHSEYDLKVGIVSTGAEPMKIVQSDAWGDVFDGVSTPLHHYVPVEMTVDAGGPSVDYFWHVHDLAEDCINQGGISNVHMIRPPARDSDQPE